MSTRRRINGATRRRPPGHVWLLLVMGAVCLYNFVAVGWAILREPHVLNYTEGISLLFALRLRDGQPLYPDPAIAPFVYLAYPPVYPLLSAAFVTLGGEHLAPLRLLSILCEAGAGLLLVRILRFHGLSRAAAWGLGLLLLGLYSTHKFHGLARLDTFVLVLELAAVDVFARSLRAPSTGRLVALAAFAALAMLTKPTAAITLGVLGAWVVWRALRGDGAARLMLMAFAGAAAMYLAAVGALQLVTDGWFWRHTISMQALSGVRERWLTSGVFVKLVRFYWPLLLVPAVLAAFARPRWLVALAGAQLAWLFAAGAKSGADSNYQLVPIAMLFLAGGIGWATLEQRFAERPGRHASLLVTLALLVSLGVFLQLKGPSLVGNNRFAWLRYQLEPKQRAYRQWLVDQVAAASPGRVLVEEPYFAIAANREFIMSDPFHLLHLARLGRYDLTPVLAEVARAPLAIVGKRIDAEPRLRALLGGLTVRKHGVALDDASVLLLLERR